MADGKTTVCGYVTEEVRDRLDELLLEGETRSDAVAQAVKTEIRIRENARQKVAEQEAAEGEEGDFT